MAPAALRYSLAPEGTATPKKTSTELRASSPKRNHQCLALTTLLNPQSPFINTFNGNLLVIQGNGGSILQSNGHFRTEDKTKWPGSKEALSLSKIVCSEEANHNKPQPVIFSFQHLVTSLEPRKVRAEFSKAQRGLDLGVCSILRSDLYRPPSFEMDP